MSGGKRLISALLALTMVGQLGLIIGMAADGTCDSTNHGLDGKMTNATSCGTGFGMHWLSSENSGTELYGGTGINYFYPKNGETIYCQEGAEKNIIIFESGQSFQNTVTINEFTLGKDDIFLPEEAFESGSSKAVITVDKDGKAIEDGGTVKELAIGNNSYCTVTLSYLHPAGQTELVIKRMPTTSSSFTVTDNNGTLSIDTTGGYIPLWKVGDGSYVTTPPSSSASAVDPYSCVVVEKETGRHSHKKDFTVTTPCFVKPKIDSFTATRDGASLKSGAVLELDGQTDYTYTLNTMVSYSGLCGESHGTTGSDHSHVIGWEVDDTSGVAEVSGNTMTIHRAKVAELATEKDIILKTTVKKQDDTVVSQDISFKVKPIVEDDWTLEILGGDSNLSSPKTITVSDASDPEIRYTYSTNAGDKAERYDFSWTLNTPDPYLYLDESTKAAQAATVIIKKDELLQAFQNLEDPEKSYNLSVTLTPNANSQSLQTRGIAVFALRTLSAETQKTASFQITVKADITPPDPPSCGKTPKTVEIGNSPQSPVSITDLTKPYTVDLRYAVTDWEGECTLHGSDAASHGEKAEWSIVDPSNPKPEWAVIDTAKGTLTLYGDKLPAAKNNTVQVQVTVTANGKPVPSAPVTITVERPEIVVTGPAGAAAAQDTINISGSSTDPVSRTYSVNLPTNDNTNYGFKWTLKKENSQEADLPEYIKFEPDSNGKAATVTVITSAIPAAGVNETYLLTVTASTSDLSLNTLSAVMPLIGGEDDKVATYKITVYAPAKSSSPSGSGGSSGSSGSSSNEPDYSDWYQWQGVEWDINNAKAGSTVKVSLGSNTDMPYYILEALQGEEIRLQMRISGGYTWTVNGKSVQYIPKNLLRVPLGVESYSNSKLTALCRESKVKSFKLENTGSFYSDMRLTMNLGSSYAKKTVYLYSYDEDRNRLTYSSSAKVADTGEVDFIFTHSLGAYAITSQALYGESAVGAGGGAVGGNNPSVLYPPVVSLPAATQTPASGPSAESSPSDGEADPPPVEAAPAPDPDPDSDPVDTVARPEPESESAPIPIMVPLLILAIAGVITAAVVVVNSSRSRGIFDPA